MLDEVLDASVVFRPHQGFAASDLSRLESDVTRGARPRQEASLPLSTPATGPP